jgi:hypothetical protein
VANVRNMTLGSKVAAIAAPTNSAQEAPNSGRNTATGFSLGAARSELDDAMTGRITLAILDLVILGMVVFYLYTRSAQGGG